MLRPVRNNKAISKKAFTLVEVILAITIFSFVAVGISTSFFSGMKLWGRAISTDSWRNDILLRFESIAAELRQCVNLPDIGFSGTAKSVSFLTVPGNSIIRISYSFDAQKKALIRRETKLKDITKENTEDRSEGRSVISVDEFSFEYLYRDFSNGMLEWKSEWKKEDGIFIAVRFKSRAHDEEFNKTVFIPIAE